MPRRSRLFRSIAPLLLLAASTGCRSISVASEPSPTYSIDVRNETAQPLIVSYNAGARDAILGTVSAGGSERFIIAGATSPSVTVSARTESGGRTYGPYALTLVPGTPQTVRIR